MAYVLSSVSGNLISAASAGYAPTNSGDVSAIASAYQVVSATATQLYAGTAYVTSINDAPVSAARAGNASNASLANSAWYDGTGRFISALPDSAAVSAIASSYVESGVSSKQDTLSFAYNTADQISSINGSALGGMDEAAVSGIASAYAESAVSSKADSSALSSYVPYSSLEYNTASAISGINGSALAGTTYSAGTGIDITDDVISVETPVDIVAGPGIVIDNPDGNTLRVSTDENYEVDLYSNANGDGASTGISLSENPFNFEKIIIRFSASNGLVTKDETIPLSPHAPTRIMISSCTINDAGNRCYLVMGRYSISSTTLTRVNECQSIIEQQSIWTDFNQNMILIYKVIGVHRIANN